MFENPQTDPPTAQEDEELCDVPRSDSAATVALDIDADRQSLHSLDFEPEIVDLESPEKPSALSEDTALPSNDTTDDVLNVPLDPLPEVSPVQHICDEGQQVNDQQAKHQGIITQVGLKI